MSSSSSRLVISASRKTPARNSGLPVATSRVNPPTVSTAAASRIVSGPPTVAKKSSPRKSSVPVVIPSTAPSRDLLKPRRQTNPSILPVLCIYSDKNQLVRKEQFRNPAVGESKIPGPKTTSGKVVNNENLRSSSQLQRPTLSSIARIGNSNNNDNHAKRSKLAVPRSSTAAAAAASKTQVPKFKEAEKVIRRRNEKSLLPVLHNNRKAEMTTSSSSGNIQNRAASHHQPPTSSGGVGGGKPANVGTGSSKVGDCLVRGSSVPFQPAAGKEATSHRPAHCPIPALTPKGVTSPRRPIVSNKQKETASITPASLSFSPFTPANSRAKDNPDLKKESQGSTVAAAVAPDQVATASHHHRHHHAGSTTELVIADAAPSGLAAVNSSSSSPPCHVVDNYVLEYPTEVAQLRKVECVMGTQPADAGYASEKSPDDDNTPDLVRRPLSTKEDDLLDDFFQFVSDDNITKVTVQKTAQGLGLSVTGGVAPSVPGSCFSSPYSGGDSGGLVACSWPGLIRIKKIFPHGAAWQTGKLAVGDVLLAANGQPLTGCTNYEALEMLRCTPRETELEVCRIPQEIAEKMGIYPTEASTIPSNSSHTNWLAPVLTLSVLGEFEISMTKVNGSLGFTLRKEDESILGHYIRSLVKEPAISDGRILPGDKIISVNGVDMSAMSHSEAVAFLRRCPETVTIRLFRDSAITPISPLSPTETETTLNRPRPLLRQEAQDLLHDLAVRKQGGSRGGSPAPGALSGSPCSPRRRRLTKTPSPDLAAVVKDRFGTIPPYNDNACVPPNSGSSPPMSPLPEIDMERDALTKSPDLTDSDITASFHTPSYTARVTRPDFLDLSNSLVKKQKRYMFSTPPNGQPPSSFEERQSGDGQPETPVAHQGELDITEYHTPSRMADSILDEDSRKSFTGSFRICDDPLLLPKDHSTMDFPLDDTMDEEFVSFHSSSTLERYAPAGLSDRDLNSRMPLPDNGSTPNQGNNVTNLSKWKGIVLTPDEEYAEEAHLGLIQTIELNKGWNSRLGFSVGISDDGQLVISAIYEDSVAAKDGRLEVGDHVLRVNGEKLAGCTKDYVIDVLRKTRGPVAITVRKTG